jgi:hypothetical protein
MRLRIPCVSYAWIYWVVGSTPIASTTKVLVRADELEVPDAPA